MILIVYKSTFGNTKAIAETIAKECGTDSRLISSDELIPDLLIGVNLLIAGSPTIAWRFAPGFDRVFDVIKSAKVAGLKAAAFDTGLKGWYAGNAAQKIAKQLQKAGCSIIGEPMRFYVLGKEGPLKDGELERARQWMQSVKANL